MPVSEHDREQAREDFEQLVTEILFALEPHLRVLDGPDVDDARHAVMHELLAHWEAGQHAG